MNEKKPWQKGPLGCLAFTGFLLLFFVIIGTIIGSLASKPSNTEKTPQGVFITPTPNQITLVPTKTETMTDKLSVALDKSIKSRNGYSVEYDETSKTASITKVSTAAWDESALVRESFTILVKFGTEVFKIEGVDAARVIIRTELTDQYGKKSVEDVVRIIMNKSEFGKFDWNNLNYQPVYTQIKNASEAFYIHPAILKNLNPDKLYLAI